MQALVSLLAFFTLFSSVISVPVPEDPIVLEEKTSPPDDKVYISGLSYGGTGCPYNSVTGRYASTDRSVITLIFDKYVASVGPGIPWSESRKNCQLLVDIVYPEGWTYSLYSTQYKGWLSLNKKVYARQQSEYWFPGYDGSAIFYSEWNGGNTDKGYSEDYDFTDEIEDKEAIWSPCKGSKSTVTINTQIRVDNTKNSKGSGLITTDSITHKVTHKYALRWKKCKRN